MVKKSVIICIARVIACFLTLIICCSTQANQLEDYLESMLKNIKQKKPVYAISVTRTTQRNDETDYLPLSPSKRFTIFSILNRFLGAKCDNPTFEKLLSAYIETEIEDYKHILNIKEQYKVDFLKDVKFLQEYQNKYSKIKGKKKDWDLYIQENADWSAQDKLQKTEKRLMTFWGNNKKEKLLQQYTKLYGSTVNSIGFATKSIETEDMAIVVFNEMFFGKNAPFYKGIIENEVVEHLSSINPNKIFHVNFLTIENKTFLDIFDVKSFINDNKGDSWRFFTGSYNSYKDYIDKIYAQYPLVSFVENKPIVSGFYEQKLRVLENVSRIYLGRNEEAFYNKSSYQMEDDVSIDNGAFYVFGEGIDKLSNDINKNNFVIEAKERIKQLENIGSDCACSEHLCNLYLNKNEVLMPSFMSTEICYDLELGIRYKYKYYPQDLRIHIVPSNTLAFRDDTTTGNTKHLPFHAKLVLHVDPVDSALYQKVPTTFLGKYDLELFHRIGDGMCVYIYQFKLDESTYTIKIWNLSFLL